MSAFIKQFEKDYIYELQNIPYYNIDEMNGATKREILSWFDEDEIEVIFESAKVVVANFFEEKNCKWVLEDVEFADDVEQAVCLCMTYGCLSRVLDKGYRSKKIKDDPRFKGCVTEKEEESLTGLKDEYDNEISRILYDIVARADRNLQKMTVS